MNRAEYEFRMNDVGRKLEENEFIADFEESEHALYEWLAESLRKRRPLTRITFDGADNVDVGLAATGPLWDRFINIADSKGVPYSKLIETMLTEFLEGK